MTSTRATELFEQAIEIAPDAREAWLAEVCASDDELRAEVERMLRIDEKASAFLETPPDMLRQVIEVRPA